ncbi:peptidylprolyl isomerase [Sphingomonas sp. SRS2]|uniref:peptidylprolyl isomerase n=1 Tax=Sphingomonas sp. SRS2 TaxID=133190 RepID=UPI00061848A9|nr:peptidylprolyl isomerase [Sphingomonas sp. SRS2]KKC27060.1 peptidylprolyl isomerase [Sphingomonas sp. SRS2]
MIRRLLLLVALILCPPVLAAPSKVRVALKTSEGTITVAVDVRRAPITANNFLAYVDQKKFDGTSFYRAAPARGNAAMGLIQGGIRRAAIRSLLPIAHEPTSRTGLRHVDGTISMARGAPGSAMGDFFILAGPSPAMDARPGGQGDSAGYAAFGKVVSGMPVVKRILAAKTWPGGAGAMKGQMIRKPIVIIEARRVD